MARRPIKSKALAVILALFGGPIGAHRFYLGEGGAGIFYIMLTIFTVSMRFPVTTILGVFDAFRLLMMSGKQFDRLYNSSNEDGLERRRRQHSNNQENRRQRQNYSQRRNKSTVTTKVNPYKNTGVKKYKEYDLEGAIEDFNQGLKIEPRDVSLHFNLACAYSLQEEKEKSLYHLNEAIKNGFKDIEKINTHDDLAFLRIQQEFEKFKANGYKVEGKINVNEKNLLEDDMLLSQLNKLAELRKKGLLSDEEFNIEKKKLMKR